MYNRQLQLLKACADGDKSLCDQLLATGCKINGTETVIYPSCNKYPRGLTIVGTSPVLEAISHGHIELAEHLITKGAELKYITPEGYTALHLTAYLWRENALKWLIIKHGFNIDVRDNKRFDVYDAAKVSVDSSQWTTRCNILTIMTVARSYAKKDAGLVDAINARHDQPNIICNKEEHLLLIKHLVEDAGHTGIKNTIASQGFSGYGNPNNGKSAYSVAQEEGYDYLVEYFDTYLAKTSRSLNDVEEKVKEKEDNEEKISVSIRFGGTFFMASVAKKDEQMYAKKLHELFNLK